MASVQCVLALTFEVGFTKDYTVLEMSFLIHYLGVTGGLVPLTSFCPFGLFAIQFPNWKRDR